MLAGDETSLELTLGKSAACFVGTQASTKIYRNPNARPCSHSNQVTLEADSLLVMTPDPVQAFAAARFTQHQVVRMMPTASLVLLDWCSAGRVARGERWSFSHYHSRTELFRAGEAASFPGEGDRPGCRVRRPAEQSFAHRAAVPLGETPSGATETVAIPNAAGCGWQPERFLLDALLLDPADGPLAAPERMGRFNCLANLTVVGPAVRALSQSLLEEVAVRPLARGARLICAASPVAGGALLRLAGESLEEVSHEIRRHLAPIIGLIGGEPWARK